MQAQIITSESNEKLKVFKSLTTAKGIKEHHQFILSGTKVIEEFLNQKLARFKPVCFIFESDTWPYFIQKNAVIPKLAIPRSVFKEIDVVGTGEPLLVLEFNDFEKKDFTKAADSFKKLERIILTIPLEKKSNFSSVSTRY